MGQKMLVNLSNHPSDRWPAEQTKAAKQEWTKIKDLAFPAIPPEWGPAEVHNCASDYLEKCLAFLPPNGENAVHLMGEMTFTVTLVQLLQKAGVHCVASTSKRNAVENDKGEKVVQFEFRRFRRYPDFINPPAD